MRIISSVVVPADEQNRNSYRRVFWTLAAIGVAAHFVVAIFAGNHSRMFWSGGGDVEQYITLASNVRAGDGFTYAHTPTAFRPPLYPLLLALLMLVSASHWLALLHAVQFCVSLVTAAICARIAATWFGSESTLAALAVALLLPTQLYFTGEALTECTASLLGILFFFLLDRAISTSDMKVWVYLGVITGAAALERFNAAGLGLIGAIVALGAFNRGSGQGLSRNVRNFLLFAASCLAILSPWLVHTATAFHGQVLFSTHTGFAAVEGVLSPTGRAQEGEITKLIAALGWTNTSIETNTPAKPESRDEIALNRQALKVAKDLWPHVGWRVVPILAEKVGAFWFGSDQILHISLFSARTRLMRRCGVAVYLIILVLGVAGWFRLRTLRPEIARVVLFSTVFLTLLHLPFTMNTRLRSPLFDPLLATLSAGAMKTRRAAQTERLAGNG